MAGTELVVGRQFAPRAGSQPGWVDGEPEATTDAPKHASYHPGVACKQANAHTTRSCEPDHGRAGRLCEPIVDSAASVRDGLPCEAAGIAGPVQALVVLHRGRAERRQRGREREHALGQAGVQADPFGLGLGRLPRACPRSRW